MSLWNPTCRRIAFIVTLGLIVSNTPSARSAPAASAGKPTDLAPVAITATHDGQTLFVACSAGKAVLFVDPASGKVRDSVSLPAPATGIALAPNEKSLYVTCGGPESIICVLDVTKPKIAYRLPAGHTSMAPVVSPDGKVLFVCNRFNNSVSMFDLSKRKELKRVPVGREPVAADITPDGKYLLVANHLPTGRADADSIAATVSLVDAVQGLVVKDFLLPNGSSSVADVKISPDGKHAAVTHVLSRYPLPTSQLERGWMNTNAKTLIDLTQLEIVNTVLLDTVDRGAANPWGIAWSADSRTIVVAIAGTHEISVTDVPGLLTKLESLAGRNSSTASSGATPASLTPQDVPNDLSFLVGVRTRISAPEGDLGPRSVVVAGHTAFAANYFSDTLTAYALDGATPARKTIPLGPKSQLSGRRLGELYFNDARICFQGWQTCATCHPGEGRVDGFNWDLLNDGIGNPKNTKNLLLAFQTPPAMSIAVRESAEVAVRAGIRHILFTVQPPEVALALDEYIKSLQPIPSPLLVNGKLSPSAQRGEKIFKRRDVGCAQCHPSGLFTDTQSYDVGTRGRFDKETDVFDTPTLIEVWRTAPYLHDGSAATIMDVLTTRNKNDQHGKTSHLSQEELKNLADYVNSI